MSCPSPIAGGPDLHAIWFQSPARFWEEGLAIGNGRLGAVIFGGAEKETILLNEETLASGKRGPSHRSEVRGALEAVRALIREKRYEEADRLAEASLYDSYTEPYLPLGTLTLLTELPGPVTAYRRTLDMKSACGQVQFESGGSRYFREAFVSEPDQVFALRMEVDGPARLQATLHLESPLQTEIHSTGNLISCEGLCPTHRPCWGSKEPATYDEDSLRWGARLLVVVEEGRVEARDGNLHLRDARAATVLFVAGSNFRGQRPDLEAVLASAKKRSFAALRSRHLEDFSPRYNRCALHLENAELEMPTDERLRRASEGQPDPALDALLFHFGRYLLLSCSRPGTLAANLQGIWNPYMQPPWSCNYTMNINVQMNYWPSEVTGLEDCHEPLFDLLESLRPGGRQIARENYGCRGFCAHHQTDLTWQAHARGVTPTGVHHKHAGRWAMWPMAAAWLCRHLWEHHDFSNDSDFLEQRAWPVLREASEFFLDWLVEGEDGALTTSPSTSPENMFRLPDGTECSLSEGSTMDLSLIQDLFQTLIQADELLKKNDPITAEVRASLPRIRPFRIGRHGQLQEWKEDWDRPDDKHRHVSHLYALYPGNDITPEDTPELAAAARQSLEMRGDEGTGWSRAWKVSLWARLKDGNRALKLLRQFQNFVQPTAEPVYDNFHGGMYPNLFSACPPLQIDGNFGVTAGIAEMLLQSHRTTNEGQTILEILPALPAAWSAGNVHGLRARGGFTVAITWSQGRLQTVGISGKPGAPFCLRANGTEYPHRLDANGQFTSTLP